MRQAAEKTADTVWLVSGSSGVQKGSNERGRVPKSVDMSLAT